MGSSPLTPEQLKAEDAQLQKIADEIGPGNYKGLERWLTVHMHYREDRSKADLWHEPSQIIAEGRGACTAYGTLALAILKHMNTKECYLLGVSPMHSNHGHVVAIFRDKVGDYWRYYDFEVLKSGSRDFKGLYELVGRTTRYGSHVEYKLANRDMKEIKPEEEASYGINS